MNWILKLAEKSEWYKYHYYAAALTSPVNLSIMVVENPTSGSKSNANTILDANAKTGTPPEIASTTGSSFVLTISNMIKMTKNISEVAIFEPLLLFFV